MEQQRVFTKVVLASLNGRFFRLITEPLTEKETGVFVVILYNDRGRHGGVSGQLFAVTPDAYMIRSRGSMPDIVVNPAIVIGWTTQRRYMEDMDNERLQSHPEEFCSPGTFDPDGRLP